MNRPTRNAIIFLTIFLMVNGLLDPELVSKYRPLFTSRAILQIIILAFIVP